MNDQPAPDDREPTELESVTALEQALVNELDQHIDYYGLDGRAEPGEIDLAEHVAEIGGARLLAEAIAALSATRARLEALRATAPPPPFDPVEVGALIWQATQDAGAPTAAGDAAVNALRKACGLEPLQEGP